MKVKDGDVVEFLAISWDVPRWEFDHPTVILKPVIQYSPNGEDCESMIEDMAINLSCGDEYEDEDISDMFIFQGFNLKTLKRVCKKRLAGDNKEWKTILRNVVFQKIRFFNLNGEMDFEILETINKQ